MIAVKICVVGNPKVKTTHTTKYCDLLERSKTTQATCLYATDRLECLRYVSKRKADFALLEAEDLYFSMQWDESAVLVVSEIRALQKNPFEEGHVVLVRNSLNLTSLDDLRGTKLCHPGYSQTFDKSDFNVQVTFFRFILNV